MFDRTDGVAVEVCTLLERSAELDYIGENVSQLEHALQCAQLASDAGMDEEMILAALLHDIGHLCAAPSSQRMDELGVVDHESIGGEFLRQRGFSERLVELVQGHVEAKRYLTFKNDAYRDRLSAASLGTLAHQGGPMSADEAAAFERDPLFHEKLRIRTWDEQGKEVDCTVAPLETYREMLARHLRMQEATATTETRSHREPPA